MIGDAMAEVPRAGRRCPVPCRVAVRRRSPGAVSRRAREAIIAATSSAGVLPGARAPVGSWSFWLPACGRARVALWAVARARAPPWRGALILYSNS